MPSTKSKAHPPAGISHLDASLTNVDRNDLSHGDPLFWEKPFSKAQFSIVLAVGEPLSDSKEPEELQLGNVPPWVEGVAKESRNRWKALGKLLFTKPPKCAAMTTPV